MTLSGVVRKKKLSDGGLAIKKNAETKTTEDGGSDPINFGDDVIGEFIREE